MEKSKNEKMLETLLENKREDIRREIEKINEEINKKYGIEDNEEEKQVVNVDNFKKRSFKNIIIGVSIAVSLATGAVIAIVKKPWLSDREKFIQNLTVEADIHGGAKDIDSDKYLYDLDNHIESGKCLIKGEGLPSERIQKVCEEHEISDSVTDALITRFELNYDCKYEEAAKIKPLKIYQDEQEELKEQKQDNSYGM